MLQRLVPKAKVRTVVWSVVVSHKICLSAFYLLSPVCSKEALGKVQGGAASGVQATIINPSVVSFLERVFHSLVLKWRLVVKASLLGSHTVYHDQTPVLLSRVSQLKDSFKGLPLRIFRADFFFFGWHALRKEMNVQGGSILDSFFWQFADNGFTIPRSLGYFMWSFCYARNEVIFLLSLAPFQVNFEVHTLPLSDSLAVASLYFFKSEVAIRPGHTCPGVIMASWLFVLRFLV